MSVYENIGGAAAVDAAVDIFYRKVLSDESISDFFDSVDMDGMRAKQKSFLTMVFGGPNEYSGADMREAHKHLDLKVAHFDAVATHLVETLKELNVAQSDIDEITAIALSVEDDVLNL